MAEKLPISIVNEKKENEVIESFQLELSEKTTYSGAFLECEWEDFPFYLKCTAAQSQSEILIDIDKSPPP